MFCLIPSAQIEDLCRDGRKKMEGYRSKGQVGLRKSSLGATRQLMMV